MKEQIIKLARETFPLYHNMLPEYEQKFKDFADEIDKLYSDKPDKAEIRGENKTCDNCKRRGEFWNCPDLSYCLCTNYKRWEPIKTE